MNNNNEGSFSIIDLENFIQATRDSGYKSTVSAIAELIDNSIQANATQISVTISNDDEDKYPIKIAVTDNGDGMDSDTLRTALRFGGSSRFNSRSGLGRFGMGLPNASFSQSKTVKVITWQDGNIPIMSRLDLDAIANGSMKVVPFPQKIDISKLNKNKSISGTSVIWDSCDRIDYKRVSSLEKSLMRGLGQMFRYFIWSGIDIIINDNVIKAFDPLYLNKGAIYRGATKYCHDIHLDIKAFKDGEITDSSSRVKIKITELPLDKWFALSREEKRKMKITSGSGVSVVRANREVEYGWFFSGGKRRENYDDWWRCEVHFDPVLDDAFGVSHTKQQIKPQQYVEEAISDCLSPVFYMLNKRVRDSFAVLKSISSKGRSELKFERNNRRLEPVREGEDTQEQKDYLVDLSAKYKMDTLPLELGYVPKKYSILEVETPSESFIDPLILGSDIVLSVNLQHSFYKKIYKPSKENKKKALDAINDLLLAYVHAELTFEHQDRMLLSRFRKKWGSVLDKVSS